jgi:hypothetical protein
VGPRPLSKVRFLLCERVRERTLISLATVPQAWMMSLDLFDKALYFDITRLGRGCLLHEFLKCDLRGAPCVGENGIARYLVSDKLDEICTDIDETHGQRVSRIG